MSLRSFHPKGPLSLPPHTAYTLPQHILMMPLQIPLQWLFRPSLPFGATVKKMSKFFLQIFESSHPVTWNLVSPACWVFLFPSIDFLCIGACYCLSSWPFSLEYSPEIKNGPLCLWQFLLSIARMCWAQEWVSLGLVSDVLHRYGKENDSTLTDSAIFTVWSFNLIFQIENSGYVPFFIEQRRDSSMSFPSIALGPTTNVYKSSGLKIQ